MNKYVIIAAATIFALVRIPAASAEDLGLDNIRVSVYEQTASVFWTTDVSTTGTVEYGTTSGSYTTTMTTDSDTVHRVYLANLAKNTTYYYRITVEDLDGATEQSNEKTFTTVSPTFVISLKQNVRSSNKVIVHVRTNKTADLSVAYGTTADALTQQATTLNLFGGDRNDEHFVLRNLKANTTYYYQARATIEKNGVVSETVTSDVKTVTTRGVPKITSISRTRGSKNTILTIKGKNFGESIGNATIKTAVAIGCSLNTWPTKYIGEKEPTCLTTILSWSDTTIQVRVGRNAVSGRIYVGKAYQPGLGNFDGKSNIFTVKGPTFTVLGR